MHSKVWRRTTVGTVAVFVCLAGLLSGCSDGGGGGSDSSTDETTSSAVIEEARAATEAAFEAGTALPPTDGPTAKPGVKLFYLTAGLASASGTEGAAAVEEAAAEMDWEVRVFDGKFSPDTYQEGLRQALSWGADAVLLYGVDCPGNEEPLKALRDAGVVISGISSVDCDEGTNTGESLFDAMPAYLGGAQSPYEYYIELGRAQADWVIAQSDGEAKVIEFPIPDFLVTAASQLGFEERMAECTGCEIVDTISIGLADFGPEVQDKAEQALLRHPDADFIVASTDDLMTFGIASAVTNSGRVDELGVVAGSGYPANMDLIRNNAGQDAGYGYEFLWDHFAGLDAVNRVLQDQSPGEVGPPVILIDVDHNLPPAGEQFVSLGDFESVFFETWRG